MRLPASSLPFSSTVCKPVVVLVRLAIRYSLLVVRAGYDRRVTVQVDLQIGEFGNHHSNGRVGAMCDISRLAEGGAVLNRNDEVLGEERGQDVNFVLPVRIGPFHLQGADLCGIILLRDRALSRSQHQAYADC